MTTTPHTELQIRSTNDAWEFHYELLHSITEKGLCVLLDGEGVQLERMEGMPYSDDAKLVYHLYNPTDGQYDEEETVVPLFDERGECTIKDIVIL